MKLAIRHFLITLAWVGLLLGHGALARDWESPDGSAAAAAEVVPTGPARAVRQTKTNDSDSEPEMTAGLPEEDTIVGAVEPPVGGVFGDTPAGACEFCGGGNCLPPTWSLENSIEVMAMSRANNQRLGTSSLPAGPLNAGSISTTNSNGITTSNQFIQYLNDAVQISALEVHTPSIDVSPAWGIKLSRFLGRDGESRDHFIEVGFNGMESFTQFPDAINGSIIPFFNTTPIPQTIPAPPPDVLFFQGSLVSPYPIFLPITGNQQQLINPSFTILGENYDKAFNRATTMSTNYESNFNECELNYRIASHNQPDQLVLNPNGRWYRQCETGYYYSYFFGLKAMVINEHFNFQSAGSQFAAVNEGSGVFIPGALQYNHQGFYGVNTSNTMLGLQTGGKLEYRFCRWCVDAHGNAGMFLNIARQDSHIQTNFSGPDLPTLSDGSVAQNTDNSFGASSNAVAFAGGFGVAGSYKIRPNVTGRISYDMLFVGDVARAPDQLEFNSVPESVRDIINTKGSIFYDGFSFGVDIGW